MTLKDHKSNLENNATTKIVNPAENDIGWISKIILENITKKLQNRLQLLQWNNATADVNWFKKIKTNTTTICYISLLALYNKNY